MVLKIEEGDNPFHMQLLTIIVFPLQLFVVINDDQIIIFTLKF